jgi:hypothetical protein
MRVNLYHVDYSMSGESLEWTGTAADFASNNDMADSDYAAMRNELERAGRYWIGGGAAPLFLLMRARESMS